jgi:hypothetical protein
VIGCRGAWVHTSRRWWITAVLCVLVSACHGSAAVPLPPTAEPSSKDGLDSSLPLRAKIFLVAGGHDSANFAQEIVDQRRIWRAAGFAEDEIACYWAKPTAKAFIADRAQYESLTDELRSCHRADPRVLRRHIEAVARRRGTADQVPFVYLYITSHGSRSVLADARASKQRRNRELAAGTTPCERRLLDRPAIVLAGSRPGALHVPSIVEAMRNGAEPDDLFLTPHSLRTAMATLGPDVPKIVVLQGCYTGGFIGAGGNPRSLDGLATLANLTLITAARHDRTSFGCQPGVDRTEFGRAYNQVLAATSRLEDPPRVWWRSVYNETRSRVERREGRRYAGRSYPRFFRSKRRVPPAPSHGERCVAPSVL